jgi:small conductance mechanosensitive channel
MVDVVFRIAIIIINTVILIAIFEFLMRVLRKRITAKGNKRMAGQVINIFRLIFYSFLGIVELGIWGANILSILAGAGFLGIIIGLAVQQPLSNFFSGIYVVISRIVRRDDVISVNCIGSGIIITGKISHIGFSHTELIDKSGKLNVVPNNVLVSSILIRHDRAKRHTLR